MSNKKTVLTATIGIFIIFGSVLFSVQHVRGGTSITSSLTLGNAAPTVVNLKLNNNSSIVLIVATTTNINITAQISDNNSCPDLDGGTTTILLYRSGVTSSTCMTSFPPNPANCYVATAFTATSTCTGMQTTMDTTTTIPMQYYAQATDASSSFSTQSWIATVIFSDPSGATASGDSAGQALLSLSGVGVSTGTLEYGSVAQGTDTSSTDQLVNVINAGNTSTTIQVSGTALASGSNVIATSSQHYATSSFTYGGGEQSLPVAATTITGINIAPVFNFPIGGAGWQNVTALPSALGQQAAVAYNGYIYATGGCPATTCGGIFATTSTVNFAPINATGSLGAWTSTQALPYTDSKHTSVAYNGYLYVIGGDVIGNNTVTSTVLYAPINATGSLGAWTSTQALPYTDSKHTSVAYNGYLYTIGGFANGITSTVLYAPINATGSLGAWTIAQALPHTFQLHTSVAYNGYLYVIGGTTPITSTVLFAPINATGSLGAWTSTHALPYTDEYHTSLAYNGYLYVIGGVPFGTVDTSTVLFAPINATGSIGVWASTQALSYAVDSHTSVVYNGYLYTIGGCPGGSCATSTVLFAPLNARSTYWGVSVSSTAVRGSYTGAITFTAVYSP